MTNLPLKVAEQLILINELAIFSLAYKDDGVSYQGLDSMIVLSNNTDLEGCLHLRAACR